MEQVYIIILSVLFSALLGLIGFWMKSAHAEIKLLVKELTTYTSELKGLIVGIQTQINKSIETDIEEIKSDVKTLFEKTNRNQSDLSNINAKIKK